MNFKTFFLSSLFFFLSISSIQAKPQLSNSTDVQQSDNVELNDLDDQALNNNEFDDFSQLPEEELNLLPEEKQTELVTTVKQINRSVENDNESSPSTTSGSPTLNIDPQVTEVILADQVMEQINSVSQLGDVSPTDWAYEALRSLVERYGCIVGYPDATFRGDRSLSRYEFAAGLNACMQQMERLIAESETVLREDLEILKRLAKEYEQELALIRTRLDNLEGRLAFLEDNSFSTTVIMNSEVIFGIAGVWGGNPPGGCNIVPDDSFTNGAGIGDVNDDADVDCFGIIEPRKDNPDNNPVFAYLARIGLQSSFTGKDRLRMYLTTGNFDNGGFTNPESFNTYGTRFGYQAGYNNKVVLDILEYRFPAFDDRVALYAAGYGFALSNVLTSNSPFFDVGRGAISRFGQLNPILRIGGPMQAGVGFDWLITDPLRLQFAYGTRDSGDPEQGFFGSDHSALGTQLLLQPSDNILTGITYVNAYSSDGTLGTYTGSINAETLGLWSNSYILSSGPNNGPICGICDSYTGSQPAQINAVGASFQWRLAENLTFATWGGYIWADFLRALPNDPELGDSAGKKPFAEAATFTVSLGLSDPFGREGDLLGFIFGMPPKLVNAGPKTVGTPVPFFEQVINNEEPTVVTDNNPNIFNGKQNVGQPDKATSLHFELFYRFKVNDNIWITPGMFILTNPGHIASNDTIYAGTIRTTFRF
jgi:hypothetical protein